MPVRMKKKKEKEENREREKERERLPREQLLQPAGDVRKRTQAEL